MQKLEAIEQLLESHTSWHGNLVYLQICEPITSQAQQELQSDLAASVFEYAFQDTKYQILIVLVGW